MKLKAIEARLKLKKLQKAKRSGDTGLEDTGRVASRAGSSTSTRNGRSSALEPPIAFRPETQVPLSPIRKRMESTEPRSPARILLGIDKGLKAQDISLKRPRSDGGLSRTNPARSAPPRDEAKPKSFSERISESRLNALEQETKEQRIQSARSQGFGLQQRTGNDVFGGPRPSPRLHDGGRSGSRQDDVAPPATRNTTTGSSLRKPTHAAPPGAKSTAPTPSIARSNSQASTQGPAPRESSWRRPEPAISSDTLQPSDQESSEASSTYDSYSGIHLSRRQIDHTTLTRTFQGKELFQLPNLLKDIKGP